jgi:hypothetical protein
MLFASHQSSPLQEAIMGFLFGPPLVVLLAIGLAQVASADLPAPAAATMPLTAPGMLTEGVARQEMDG